MPSKGDNQLLDSRGALTAILTAIDVTTTDQPSVLHHVTNHLSFRGCSCKAVGRETYKKVERTWTSGRAADRRRDLLVDAVKRVEAAVPSKGDNHLLDSRGALTAILTAIDVTTTDQPYVLHHVTNHLSFRGCSCKAVSWPRYIQES